MMQFIDESLHLTSDEKWFTMKRQHALIVMADSLYYRKFKLYCRPGMEYGKNCYADEHYLPTFFHMTDPGGVANWSVTFVDWSERKWHPRSFRAQDVTFELLRNMTNPVTVTPCTGNGLKRACYLFDRKFYPETLEKLISLFSNYTVV
ncbi:glycosyltransferase BC10 isoform X4 [Beta vulgaris subsp. vulgaris]|uniref:glycosyltransferase BC10 isoform X4 n=1 Tax=Beta vulgaris subsp. vulgaris TaxID=3555 RepID=UPI0020368E1E|nr:glycosyltransferase BC10 isoform X4 [Beta vulgaris subsp. vulgaris]